jgi:hypothetical protein
MIIFHDYALLPATDDAGAASPRLSAVADHKFEMSHAVLQLLQNCRVTNDARWRVAFGEMDTQTFLAGVGRFGIREVRPMSQAKADVSMHDFRRQPGTRCKLFPSRCRERPFSQLRGSPSGSMSRTSRPCIALQVASSG